MSALSTWNAFFKSFKEQNPNLGYKEAQNLAADAYAAQRGIPRKPRRAKKPKVPKAPKAPKAPKMPKVKAVRVPKVRAARKVKAPSVKSMSSVERTLLAQVRKKLNECTKNALKRTIAIERKVRKPRVKKGLKLLTFEQ